MACNPTRVYKCLLMAGIQEPPSQELPDMLLTVLEEVARRMHADRGTWTLELRFQNGKLDRWFRHEGPAYQAGLAKFADTS